MKAGELYDAFRTDVDDLEEDFLWTEDEVWRYMADAYRMFVRLTGGIPDTTSSLTKVPVIKGRNTSRVSPLILRFRTAYLKSTGRRLTIVNDQDEPLAGDDDYGHRWSGARDDTPGEVCYMLIGRERNNLGGLVQWIRTPREDDSVDLSVYRLPIDKVDGNNPAFDFYEVGEEHHEKFLTWMKHKAYGKQDAETFDRGRRDEYEAEFRRYCAQVVAEVERYKAKVHVVDYGGI